jgi:hypothetical protein
MLKRQLFVGLGLVILLSACGSSTGSSGNAATASSPGSVKFTCAKDVCTLPAELQRETLCCKDPFVGGCGIKSGSSCRDIPKIDARCPVPSVMIRAFPGTASETFGCCTAQNECGVDMGMTMGPMGMASGCQARSALCNSISKADAANLHPQSCDGTELPLPDNCGSDRMFPGGPGGPGAPGGRSGGPPAAGGGMPAAGTGAAAGSGGS